MNNRLLFLFILIIFISETAFSEVSKKITEYHEFGLKKKTIFYDEGKEIASEIYGEDGKAHVTGEIPDGIVKEYFDSGKIKKEASYKDNKLEGVTKGYFEKSGIIATIFYYKGGDLDGIAKTYYENGNLKTEASYKDGRLEEKLKAYYENGKLWSEQGYKDNKREGVTLIYYKNGSLMGEDSYKDGVLEGVSRSYYEEGEGKVMKDEKIYKKGKIEGIKKSYYKDGTLWMERFYKNGRLEGGTRIYNNNGILSEERMYKNDKLDGESHIYNLLDGKVSSIEKYKAGKKISSEIVTLPPFSNPSPPPIDRGGGR